MTTYKIAYKITKLAWGFAKCIYSFPIYWTRWAWRGWEASTVTLAGGTARRHLSPLSLPSNTNTNNSKHNRWCPTQRQGYQCWGIHSTSNISEVFGAGECYNCLLVDVSLVLTKMVHSFISRTFISSQPHSASNSFSSSQTLWSRAVMQHTLRPSVRWEHQ